MNGRENVRTGIWGEWQAARLLKKAGYKILAWRYRCAGGEIDLVAMDHQVLVFVEVKVRSNGKLGDGVHAVNHEKRRRIRAAAKGYLARSGRENGPVRFDVVEISAAGARHMVNAF